MDKMLSKYLRYDRAVYSGNAIAHGIPNVPDGNELKNLQGWGTNIYDKVVEHFGMVFPSSVFRDKSVVKDRWGTWTSVNKLAGGSISSGHPNGEAGDLDGDNPSDLWATVDNNILFQWVRQNLRYDQVIAEYEADGKPKWVHVGYKASGNRQMALIAVKDGNGNTNYLRYTDSLYRQIYKGSRDASDFLGVHEFEMPVIDYLTAIDETLDMGYDQEVKMNRAAADISAETEPEEATVQESGATLKFEKDGLEITLRIEIV